MINCLCSLLPIQKILLEIFYSSSKTNYHLNYLAAQIRQEFPLI
ncbi:hypothetical protein LEP1GSC107_3189 [Leptospira interrogans serovar Grippotyphosa str. UI 12769]|nr:hypothetical protein LEP1GSC097_2812 [Leptospira interrogans serovar Grippotyphosa str. UI 08368]EMN66100.1 hypothetical protein LEP1GSC098_4129 [Leptospira interrogans serovar Grippotyphosa str. UI 08434]EMN85127.1 hypothetical protein LEP1GSC107_3189 [Leptospira interrogans serovar Grippotyphosa str. UI 12769]